MNWSNIFKFNKTEKLADSKEQRIDVIQDKLLDDRIIFLGTPIDDQIAENVIAKLLFLEHQSQTKDITIYINSPGGSVTSSFAIYDTIKTVKPDVTTVALGQAGGTAAILLAGGAKGKRFAQFSSRIVIYKIRAPDKQKLMEKFEQNALRVELKRLKRLLVETLVEETAQSPKVILSLMQNETILPANIALDYGFVDAIVTK